MVPLVPSSVHQQMKMRIHDINMTTVEALERETTKIQKKEWSRNKFRGALWGSSNKLKLRKAERDKSRMESMVLEDKKIMKGGSTVVGKRMTKGRDKTRRKTYKGQYGCDCKISC